MDDWSWLDELNMTELVTVASYTNPRVHHGLSRLVLESIVRGEDVALPERNIDIWRATIFTFVDQHWVQCAPLLSCPLKTRDPKSCFQCPDVQVAECTLQNHKTFLETRNRLRKKETT